MVCGQEALAATVAAAQLQRLITVSLQLHKLLKLLPEEEAEAVAPTTQQTLAMAELERLP
jgi:hypothetical protein